MRININLSFGIITQQIGVVLYAVFKKDFDIPADIGVSVHII